MTMFLVPEQDEIKCPNLTPYWQVGYLPAVQQWILAATSGTPRYEINEMESYALQRFGGDLSVGELQQACKNKFGSTLSPNFIAELLEKLLVWGVIEEESFGSGGSMGSGLPRLKEGVEWIAHPQGHWILRNPIDVTYLQVDFV